MRSRLVLACVVAALAAPAADAVPPLPSPQDVLAMIKGGNSVVQDYCIYEIDRYGNRRPVVCVPAGRLPVVLADLEQPGN